MPKSTLLSIARFFVTEVPAACFGIATAVYFFLRRSPRVLLNLMWTSGRTFYYGVREADFFNIHWLSLDAEVFHALSPKERDARACAAGYIPAVLCLFSVIMQLAVGWAVLSACVAAFVVVVLGLWDVLDRCLVGWAGPGAFVCRVGRCAGAALAAAAGSMCGWVSGAVGAVAAAIGSASAQAMAQCTKAAPKPQPAATAAGSWDDGEIDVLSYIKWVENKCEYFGMNERAEMPQAAYKKVEALIKENKEYKRKMEVLDTDFHFVGGSV